MDAGLRIFLETATIDELREYIITSEKVLAERTRVLEAIPECPLHGKHCVPYAIEWVEAQLKFSAV